MGFGKQEGVDNRQLSGTDGPCKGPVSCGCFSNIASCGNLSEPVNAVVLGKVEMLLVFMIHGVSWDSVWVDEREGFDRKRLLDRGIGCGLCNAVAMDGQHTVNSLALPRFIFYIEHQMWRYAAAEYFGTLLLLSAIALVGYPIAIATALWVGIVLVGQYSGGHFNPAVTVWALLKGNISSGRALVHVLSQLAAAVTVWKML